jgi:hypothetical protein
MNTAKQTDFQKLLEDIREQCNGDDAKINEVMRAATSTIAERNCKYLAFAKDMEILASRALAIAFLEYNTQGEKLEAVSSFKTEVVDIINRNEEMLNLNWHKQLYFLSNINS